MIGLGPPTIALTACTPTQLAACVPGITLGEARQAVAMVHRDEPVVPSSYIRRASADAILAGGWIPTLKVADRQASELDPFVKVTLRAADGELFESVRIPLEQPNRFSVCVSSQVGCALACGFCATGRLGLRRNLETWEIVEQVRIMRRSLPSGGRVHGVVFQGMGEPMANLDRVLQAIEIFREPCAFGIDARNITVSTAGLPSGIVKLAEKAPKVRLAISIGSFQSHVRAELMPVEKRHSLREVLDATQEHVRITGESPRWTVTLLDGVNDQHADADALIRAAQDFARTTGKMPRVSILAYNSIGTSDPFRRVPLDREQHFRDRLHEAGIFTHRRYSGGSDVGAACGQLAAQSRATI